MRDVGWVYLAATHFATLCLFALFGLLHKAAGSFALAPVAEGAITPGAATAVFVLALAGFGLKAGIMPLHVWLPGAHALAPSHVSALMSGVLIKVGIYGLVRQFYQSYRIRRFGGEDSCSHWARSPESWELRSRSANTILKHCWLTTASRTSESL